MTGRLTVLVILTLGLVALFLLFVLAPAAPPPDRVPAAITGR